MVHWKIYTLGGVVSAIILTIAYNTPYWTPTCKAVNRILRHNHVGDVFVCPDDGNSERDGPWIAFEKIQEIIAKYSKDPIIRQLPRDTLITIIESNGFEPNTVSHIADQILNYEGNAAEISKAYRLKQQLSKLPTEYISVILKHEYHPNVVDKAMNFAELAVIPSETSHGPFTVDRLDAKLSTIVPSAKHYHQNLRDNSEMCDHDGAIIEAGFSWVYCVCLRGTPKSKKNYVALRIKPTVIDLNTEVTEKEDSFICTVSFYTECVQNSGCYGYEPIKRVTPPQEINLGAITEENFALWNTLENQHMNANGELSFGAEVNCRKMPHVIIIKE